MTLLPASNTPQAVGSPSILLVEQGNGGHGRIAGTVKADRVGLALFPADHGEMQPVINDRQFDGGDFGNSSLVGHMRPGSSAPTSVPKAGFMRELSQNLGSRSTTNNGLRGANHAVAA